MKKILFRKLLIDYLTFASLALVSTTIVIWVFQAVNHLDIMIEDGRDYLVYLNFTLLGFPKIMSKIFPFVLFFSIFYVTNKYELNNELIIYWNFGVSKMQIINLILKFSIILMIIQIFLTALVVPHTQDLARSFLRTSTVNFFENFIKPKKFNDTIRGVTIYSDRKDRNGIMYNLYLKKEINKNEFQITFAKSGEFKEISKLPVLVLYEGSTITAKNKEYTNITFSKSDFVLSDFETNTTTYKKTQEISSNQLIKCIFNYYKNNLFLTEIENCKSSNLRNILKEFYKRFIIPLYIPILSVIPLLLISTSKENKNYHKIRHITFILGFLIIVFSEITIRFIDSLFLKNLIFITFPIFLLTIIYLFYFLKFNPKIKV